MKTIAKLIIEVFFRLLHYIVTLYLPVVFTAVTTSERVVLGILNSAEDIDVFVVNINAGNKIKIIRIKNIQSHTYVIFTTKLFFNVIDMLI